MGSGWKANSVYVHNGQMIHCAEENGRRFFTACVPDVSGWSLTQEYGSIAEAERYIDRQIANLRAHGELPEAARLAQAGEETR
jgi:hypothetical protein